MDVQQARSELGRTLAAIAKLNDREQELLAKLEAVRRQRIALDADARTIVRAAEQAELEPQEYGLLFGEGVSLAVLTASLTRLALG